MALKRQRDHRQAFTGPVWGPQGAGRKSRRHQAGQGDNDRQSERVGFRAPCVLRNRRSRISTVSAAHSDCGRLYADGSENTSLADEWAARPMLQTTAPQRSWAVLISPPDGQFMARLLPSVATTTSARAKPDARLAAPPGRLSTAELEARRQHSSLPGQGAAAKTCRGARRWSPPSARTEAASSAVRQCGPRIRRCALTSSRPGEAADDVFPGGKQAQHRQAAASGVCVAELESACSPVRAGAGGRDRTDTPYGNAILCEFGLPFGGHPSN